MKVLNRTDSSIILYYNDTTLYYNDLPGSKLDLSVQNKSKEAHENECLPVGRSTVSFTSLDAVTIYVFIRIDNRPLSLWLLCVGVNL